MAIQSLFLTSQSGYQARPVTKPDLSPVEGLKPSIVQLPSAVAFLFILVSLHNCTQSRCYHDAETDGLTQGHMTDLMDGICE